MPAIPVTSALGYIGVFSVVFGFFLILAGLKILKVEKVTVTSGSKTWGLGIILVILGIIFLLPDIGSVIQKESPTPISGIAPTSARISTALPISTTAGFVKIESTQSAILRYRVVGDNVNVYDEPSINARVIESVSAGQVVEELKYESDWIFVTYVIGNVRTTGWIQRQNLEILK